MASRTDEDPAWIGSGLSEENPEGLPEPAPFAPSATRKDLQLGRRLIHMANGTSIATAYALLFTHTQVVRIFGTIACVVYILDRIRIHYPQALKQTPWVNQLFFRAEEEFRESAMVPYAISLLLTILTFPQPIALIAIYTLAIADPLSALVGIRYGRRHVVRDKSVEGSLAFLAVTASITAIVLSYAGTETPLGTVIAVSSLLGLCGAVFEMLPIRIDDNLTIPLFVGFIGWILCGLFAIHFG
jgi:dolichol kinase